MHSYFFMNYEYFLIGSRLLCDSEETNSGYSKRISAAR